MTIVLAFAAMLIERAIGYPASVYARIGHPVGWIGALIAYLDRKLNQPDRAPGAHSDQTESSDRSEFAQNKESWSICRSNLIAKCSSVRRAAGVVTLVILILVSGGMALALQLTLTQVFGVLSGGAVLAVLASSLLAQRSLAQHVVAVADALERDGLVAGRHAVSMIVGRDPDTLDEAAVCRAAIESLAENFSDGVTAPVFWLAVAGLPGAAIYKAVNTADSMIGHLTPRHAAFGWAAARFDDLINLPASRITALALVAAAKLTPCADAAAAWQAVRRDAGQHRSPNAGWPEAAMAGALGLALAGPRVYGGQVVDDAMMGAGGRREATPADIRQALRLYHWADALIIASLGVLFAILQMIIWIF